MKLNIYGKKNGKKTVVKTYETETYSLSFGIVEDVAGIIDLDKIGSMSDDDLMIFIGKAVLGSMDTVKELLHDVFDGITDEELRHATVPEIVQVIIEIFIYTVNLINPKDDEGKNRISR